MQMISEREESPISRSFRFDEPPNPRPVFVVLLVLSILGLFL